MRATNTMSAPSRADLLREKRAQQGRERVSSTRKPASRQVHSTPVTVRSYHSSAAAPVQPLRTSRVKKQYYYTLGASGAELRLPAIPLMQIGPRLVSAFIVIVSALAVYLLGFSSQFQLSSYKVTGLQRVDRSDVEAVLQLNGTQMISIDPQAIQSSLAAAFPELTNIAVNLGFPAKLTINVTELQPVLAWQDGDATYWIDKNGTILPPRGEVSGLQTINSSELPPLVALAASPEVTADASTANASTAAATPKTYWGQQVDLQFLNALIALPKEIAEGTELVYNSQNGLGWKDPRGWNVFIGRDLTNIDQKLSIYQSIVDGLEKQGITPSEMVSVEYIDAPYYK